MSQPKVDAEVLRTLHRIHRQLTDLRARLNNGPRKVNAVEANVQHCGEKLAAVQEELTKMRMAADKKQTELKAGETKINELKTKLNTASSNREYQALKDQIDAGKMANSVRDDEILEAWEKIEKFQENVAQAQTEEGEGQKRAKVITAEVTEEEPRIRADLTRLEAELKQSEAKLPGETRDLYNRVIRHRGEDAMAQIENQYCTGCHQQIPLNICSQVILGQPKFCATCGRLLYMPEDVTPDVVSQ